MKTIRKKRKSDRSLWILLALIAVVLAVILLLPSCGGRAAKGGTTEEEAATLVRAGDEAPDFTVTMVDGSQVTLSELRGKVVLLNFWATWCPPCQEELKRVQKEIVDRFKGKDFVFLAISREETKEQVKKFRERNGYTFPMGLDPERRIYSKFATATIPRNFIIDKKGKIVEIEIGYTKESFAKMIEKLEKLLK